MTKLYSKVRPGSSYRLLQLTPELLEEIETNGKPLALKSSRTEDGLVVCTEKKTFKLRQMNQTNTILSVKTRITNDDDNDESMEQDKPLLAFGSVPYFLEPLEIQGSIDLSTIPKYVGAGKLNGGGSDISVEHLKTHSPISHEEFWTLWHRYAGIELDGRAAIIDPNTLQTVLTEILAAIVAEGLDWNSLGVDAVYKALNDEDEPVQVVESVLNKFCTLTSQNTFSIDSQNVATWLGLETLRKLATDRPVSLASFKTAWKESIPISTDWELDLNRLHGSYVCPDSSSVRYLTSQSLSSNPKQRFQQLFATKSVWDLDEITPFIDDLRSKTVKLESFVMKYARKRTVAGKITVSAR